MFEFTDNVDEPVQDQAGDSLCEHENIQDQNKTFQAPKLKLCPH